MAIVVSAIVPSSDRTTGGAAVTVVGSGFVSGVGLDVKIDGVSCSSIVFVSSTKITAVAPAGAAGTGKEVRVINPDTTHGEANLWAYYTPAATNNTVQVSIAGALVSIKRDTLDLDDTKRRAIASFQIESGAPSEYAPVRIGLGSLADNDLEFVGEVSNVTFMLDESHPSWQVECIGPIYKWKKKLAYGAYVGVSISTIARELLAGYSSGFTGVNIADDLPEITAAYPGLDLDTIFSSWESYGVHHYIDRSLDVHVFITETPLTTPDPIDSSNADLILGTFKAKSNILELRNRVRVVGKGTNVISDVDAGEDIIPVAEIDMFETTGGKALARVDVVDYTGIEAGGIGTLVGPGVPPSAAPALTRAVGTGIELGLHKYAFTFVTGAGESLPSPLAEVTIDVPSPAAPYALNLQPGAGLGLGDYYYAHTYTAGGGESLPSAVSATLATLDAPDPNAAPTPSVSGSGSFNGTYYFKFAWVSADQTLTTLLSPASGPITGVSQILNLAIPAFNGDASIASQIFVHVYFSTDGVTYKKTPSFATPGSTWQLNGSPTDIGSAPGSNTFVFRRINLTIPAPPSGPTTHTLYRTAVGGSQLKVVTTGLSTVSPQSYTDSLADGSLGSNAPVANNAHVEQIALSGIAIGPTGTTQRKVYRTVAAGSQLKLQQTIANNTATTGVTDATADASLGANAPVTDTSGLTQPTGQVNAGSSSMLTAGGGALPTDGWVIAGNQVIRYTGVTGNTLTGIPTSGTGSIQATLPYGTVILGAPALTGVTGLTHDLSLNSGAAQGSAVSCMVIRNDLTSQAAVAVQEGGDGIHEADVTDTTLDSEEALNDRGDAELALFAPFRLMNVSYDSYDKKHASGKVVSIDYGGLVEDILIQSVKVSDIDVSSDHNLRPRYSIVAANTRTTLPDLLRELSGN